MALSLGNIVETTAKWFVIIVFVRAITMLLGFTPHIPLIDEVVMTLARLLIMLGDWWRHTSSPG